MKTKHIKTRCTTQNLRQNKIKNNSYFKLF